MIPTGIPVILIGIFLPIFGSHVFGLQTYSAWNHSHHQGDILKDWISNFHTKRTVVPAETVKDALAREIVGETVREKWRGLESRNPPIITKANEDVYTFQPDGSLTVKEVFNLLQYFPLLFQKDKNIPYRIIKIPVDGKTISLKIERKDRRYQLLSVHEDPENPETNLRKDIGKVVDRLRSERPAESSSSSALHEALKTALENTLPVI